MMTQPPEPRRGANVDQLRDAIDRGRTGCKVPMSDPAVAPLGTDDEAGGASWDPDLVAEVLRRETDNPAAHHEAPGSCALPKR